MCQGCEEIRGPIADEVVRRTGVSRETVMVILVALEDMTRETQEQNEVSLEQLRELAPEFAEALEEAGGQIVSIKLTGSGEPFPASAHPRDVPEPRRGMYL